MCYPRETREIFHKFHPLVQILYTVVCIQFIPTQYLWQSTTSMSLRFSASSYLTFVLWHSHWEVV